MDNEKNKSLDTSVTSLFDLALSMYKATNIDDILTTIARKTAALFEAERLRMFAYDSIENQVYTRIRLSDSDGRVELKFPVSEDSVAGYTAFHKRTVALDDVRNPDEFAAYPGMRYDRRYEDRTGISVKSIISVPMLENGRDLIGLIQLINPRRPVASYKEELDNLEHLGKLIAQAVFQHNEKKKRPTKFDLLLEEGIVSPDEIAEAVRKAGQNAGDPINGDPVYILMDYYSVPEKTMQASLARYYLMDFLPYDESLIISPELLIGTNIDFFRKNFVVPIQLEDDTITLLLADPYDADLIREVKHNFRVHHSRIYGGLKRDIWKYIDHAEGVTLNRNESAEKSTDESGIVPDAAYQNDNIFNDKTPRVVEVVNKVIVEAYRKGVSDLHIEPGASEADTIVRFRKDGACFRYAQFPAPLTPAIISRIKIMSGLKLDEHRLPQSGKTKLKYGDSTIELRVETTPTVTGKEDVVLRILSGTEFLSIDDLDLSENNRKTLLDMAAKPYGLILAVGPTGSGKTTTLHAILHHLNRVDKKIWTVEDPVEITQPGLRQVQVNMNIKPEPFDFAKAMRSFLRADPDIIMVGEMRDKETAQTAVEASLTGHLVLSTLHTNSAPETITRLIQMGLDALNLADSLLGVLAQRLVRVLCPNCKKAYQPDQSELEALTTACGIDYVDACSLDKGIDVLYESVGCEHCSHTGFRGRAGLHELLRPTEEVKAAITSGLPVAQLRKLALAGGMRTLRMDGVRRVVAGQTTLAEVLKVCID